MDLYDSYSKSAKNYEDLADMASYRLPGMQSTYEHTKALGERNRKFANTAAKMLNGSGGPSQRLPRFSPD